MTNGSVMFYPGIEQHGVIGDRRTAALVAADGALNWFCLPDYDGASVFGTLLDTRQGGAWRFGPKVAAFGRQRYQDATAALVTTWTDKTGELELTDLMPWPQNQRLPNAESRRVVIRRLRCLRGEATGVTEIWSRLDFDKNAAISSEAGGLSFNLGQEKLGLWTSFPLTIQDNYAQAEIFLREGEEAWAVLALNEAPAEWDLQTAQAAFNETLDYWHNWVEGVKYQGPREKKVRHSAMILHLLSYAPTGGPVAAPTTSLPERIGGDRNYDYRYSWIRDASLALSILSILGETEVAQRYMDCMATLCTSTDSPLQVVYRINGELDLKEHKRTDLDGYKGSLPVRTGNRAFKQRQLDSLGYMVECVATYLERGGKWKNEYWEMIRRAVEYTIANWQKPDSGIWELPESCHFVSSKVMSWTVMDRAIKLAKLTDHQDELDDWQQIKEKIHAEVMERGWSKKLQAFQQCYEAETLDASVLLISIMDFLPANHPRVLSTLARLGETLTIEGFIHRFVPSETIKDEKRAIGEYEGAFLPATFWLASAYAKAGKLFEAEAIIERAEALAGELGLFAEEVDVANKTFLGNFPLLFSHTEYLAAVISLEKAQGWNFPS